MFLWLIAISAMISQSQCDLNAVFIGLDMFQAE